MRSNQTEDLGEINFELEFVSFKSPVIALTCDATLFFKEGFLKPPLKKEVADCEAIRRRICGDKLIIRVCLFQITRHRTYVRCHPLFQRGFNMIDRKISVHLQDFPDVSFLSDEKELVADMDLIRSICSVALSLRDHKNLRVRLPLKSLTIIGKNSARILPFKEIIADEVNVKNVAIKEEFSDLAELKLQINFKKIGAKMGAKIKEITAASKSGEWKKISEKEIEIANVKLIDDEFEIKLTCKNHDEKKFAIAALPTNDYLVSLDVEVTKELEDEGIARDIVRAIQQNRKDANLNISDHIKLQLSSTNPHICEVAKNFANYIREQVLADDLQCIDEKISARFSFENNTEYGLFTIGF